MDLIERQAAKDALAKFVPYAICDESTLSYTNGLTDAYNLICQLPSAPRWIPVSERLPEEMGDYLVCDNCQNIYVNEWITTTTTWSWHYDDGRITAWMPLPEPWKGGEDEALCD